MSSSQSLPEGWEMRLDEPSNQYYYVHHPTKTTQWEPPAHSVRPVVRAIPVKTTSTSIPAARVSVKPSPVVVTKITARPPQPTVVAVVPPKQTIKVKAIKAPTPANPQPRVVVGSVGKPQASAPKRVSATIVTSKKVTASARPTVRVSTRNREDSWQSSATTPFPPYAPNVAPIDLSYDDFENSSAGRYKNVFSVIGQTIHKHQKQGFKGVKDSFKTFTSDMNTSLGDVRAERVTLNAYPLTHDQIRWFAVNFKVRMRDDTNYWYDRQGGFLGKVGGRTKYYIDAHIPVKGEMHPRASHGDSSVLLNGREIPASECVEFRVWGMNFQGGSRLTVDGKGDIRWEGSTGPPLYNWRSRVKELQAQYVQALTGGSPRPSRPERQNDFITNLLESFNQQQEQDCCEQMEGQEYPYVPCDSGMVDESTSSWESQFMGLGDPSEGGLGEESFLQGFYESGMGGFLGF